MIPVNASLTACHSEQRLVGKQSKDILNSGQPDPEPHILRYHTKSDAR